MTSVESPRTETRDERLFGISEDATALAAFIYAELVALCDSTNEILAPRQLFQLFIAYPNELLSVMRAINDLLELCCSVNDVDPRDTACLFVAIAQACSTGPKKSKKKA